MMKCPYCGKEMKAGYIPNGEQPVQWIPNGEKPSLFSFAGAKAGVRLINHFSPIQANGYRAEAFYCEDCKLVLAPIK